jgi:peptide deformylase
MSGLYKYLENKPEHKEMMSYLAIYPDKILHQKLENFSDEELRDLDYMKSLQEKMFKVMRHFEGIGLAANQANINRRMLVLDLGSSDEHWDCIDLQNMSPVEQGPMVMINPEILELSSEEDVVEEGCLSLPGLRVKVKRPTSLRVSFLDKDLKKQTFLMKKMLGRCVQHEIDHLDGILITDKVSLATRKIMFGKKLEKLALMRN